MIFISLGTQDQSFKRLLKKVDELIDSKVIKEKVIVQAGFTKYKSKNMKILDYIPMEEFNEYIKKSNYMIVHGGVGSILNGLKQGKKVIAVPRLKKYKEHESDHQIQIVNEFAKLNYIIGCNKVDDLESAIQKIDTFKPSKYKSNNQAFVKRIDDYILSTLD